jgi:hypothetical protein
MLNIGRAIDIEQIKDEIRKLNPADKAEICRWIDHEAAVDLLFRIGMSRNLPGAEWHPKSRGHLTSSP